jgi:hypothetical protein
MPEFDFKEISRILKKLKETEKYFSLNPFRTIGRAIRSIGDPVKELRENLYKEYNKAKNGKIGFEEFVRNFQDKIFATIEKLNNENIQEKTIHLRRRMILLKELLDIFSDLDVDLEKTNKIKFEMKKLNETILKSEKYTEVKYVIGQELFRETIEHGVGLSGYLDKVIRLKYDLIVALSGEKTAGLGGKTKIRIRKDRKIYRVAKIKIDPSNEFKTGMHVLEFFPLVGNVAKFLNKSLKKIDLELSVYVVFVGGLMPFISKTVNLESMLQEDQKIN